MKRDSPVIRVRASGVKGEAMKSIFAALLIATFSASVAMAGNHSNNDMGGKGGQNCASAIHHKHPELKGAAFRDEWGKCRNDPTGYLQAN